MQERGKHLQQIFCLVVAFSVLYFAAICLICILLHLNTIYEAFYLTNKYNVNGTMLELLAFLPHIIPEVHIISEVVFHDAVIFTVTINFKRPAHPSQKPLKIVTDHRFQCDRYSSMLRLKNLLQQFSNIKAIDHKL